MISLAPQAALSFREARGTLRRRMEITPQGTMSVWRHCLLTRLAARRILRALDEGPGSKAAAQLPGWMPFDLLVQAGCHALTSAERWTLQRYLGWHDCGKPTVMSRDAQGQPHFPDHALCSSETWARIGGTPAECTLMRLDMAFHTWPAERMPELAANPLGRSLLLAAWASLWANCADFGGAHALSFKIKRKHLERRGRAFCRLIRQNDGKPFVEDPFC